MAKISRVEPTAPILKKRKQVAAYARVSMESERMNHSLSAQVSYYSSLIQKNPEWDYAGVYADDFVSGTGTAKRDEFKRMLDDCEAGKINIILTKSISRFARNTVDLLETVRHLKDIGVEVQFEREHISSFSGDGELMLTILASFAQEESRSISDNVKWGIRKRMAEGIPNGRSRVYGYRWEGDGLVIVPEEAAVVRRIFQNFLDGKSRLETEREFAAEGITTRDGCRWVDSNIKVVLTNITYTGNMLLQKEYIADPISKQRRKNRGELPQYYVEDTHPAIIDKATFDYVQEEMARRRELGCFANKSLNLSCFSTKIKCGNCGRSFLRSARKRGSYVIWTCGSKKGRGKSCGARDIPEKLLQSVCADVLGIGEFDGIAPYTNINTNLLFFKKGTPTKGVWFYRLEMPEGYKHFSKTRPMLDDHFVPVEAWWINRTESAVSQYAPIEDIIAADYNLDFCGFPHDTQEILPPDEFIANYLQEKAVISARIESILGRIADAMRQEDME